MYFLDELHQYQPVSMQEQEDKKVMLSFSQKFENTVLKRENKIAHFTASALILNPAMDKTLMVYHRLFQTWTWVGGHADGESDLYQVACREAKEETGVSRFLPFSEALAAIDILPVQSHWKGEKYVSGHLHFSFAYVLIADEKENVHAKLDENQEVRWIWIKEIPQYSKEKHMLPIYQKLLDRVKATINHCLSNRFIRKN